MEALFKQSIDDLKRFQKFSSAELKMLDNVDKAAEEMAEPEFEHYLKHEVNMDAPRIAKKYGLLGIPIKKEYGGLGSNHLVTVLTKERLGQMGLGFSSFYNVQVFLCGLSMQHWGSQEQKKTYLKQAAKGEKIFAFGLTEPQAGSDPTSMKTNYEKKEGRFVLNGTKYLITNGSIADYIIIFARSKTLQSEYSAFIVDAKSSGVTRMRLKEKIGLFTSDTAMLEFKDVEVDDGMVLGEIGTGMKIAYSGLLNGRLGVASGCIGIIEGSLNAVLSRARERVQHGKQIGKHQLIQKHIAEIAQNLEMARWPTYFAAIQRADYEKNIADKALIEEAELRTALAKKIASRLAFESADHAVQVFGGFGYSLLSPAGPLFCDSRVTRIYEGADEIMELKIASEVLGKGYEAYS
ncbi:MAG: acyl-CoA/acyl-ACP dehydrogenase [Candidatus Micrarchaeota archaeon]|nr:acyl-CoA/acyl-ACP dehydrogenase [Candidatus Micrarchaeota archaeon]MDE1834292.1 acyl-CoA/acyl-ACP dehydrogenase [Candidatus Micrarchaeota archaeon]MDE1859447.1 acyl-CoA/acyl-ACP dehydrogenase [Candidatus Micrarchaeota archaeon]